MGWRAYYSGEMIGNVSYYTAWANSGHSTVIPIYGYAELSEIYFFASTCGAVEFSIRQQPFIFQLLMESIDNVEILLISSAPQNFKWATLPFYFFYPALSK